MKRVYSPVVPILLVTLSLSLWSEVIARAESVQATSGTGSMPQGDKDVPILNVGKAIERELAGGQAHSYQIALAAGQYLRVLVEQRGIDVVVTLFGPDGKKLTEIDSPNGTQEPEPASWIAEASGSYRLEVRSLKKDAAAGRYEAKIEELRASTEKDKSRIPAEKAYAEGVQLQAQGTADSLRKAVNKYVEALPHWRAAGNRAREANTLSKLGEVYYYLGELTKALDAFVQELPLRRASDDRKQEAEALNNIGGMYAFLGEKQKALDYYNQALQLRQAVGDRKGESDTLSNIGLAYSDLGENQKALDYYNQALSLDRAVGTQGGEEALTLYNIGQVYSNLGEMQKALDYYNQALPILRAVGDRKGESDTVLLIGSVYSYLGEKQKALDYYKQALLLSRAVGDRRGEANSLSGIGVVYNSLGEKQKALDYYNQALSLDRAVGRREGEAASLSNIGAVYTDLGESQKALGYYNQALQLSRAVGDRRGEALRLNLIGKVYNSLGENQKALDYLNQALPLSRAVGDRSGAASVLLGKAVVERDRGNLIEALTHIESGLNMVEELRTGFISHELRASYLSTVQDYYQSHIDLLMRLHKQRPLERFDAVALQASERGRARSLLELLTEARADIRQGVDANLLGRERSLQRLLNDKAERQIRLLSGKHTDEQAAAAAKEIEALKTEYQQVEAQIKTNSPRYAALTQPQPLSAKEIQQLLDKDTLLLEYSVGDERSYLWAVTESAITSYELPKRAEIETAAKRFYELLTQPNQQARATRDNRGLRMAKADARSQEVEDAAATLSKMLLVPVASQLAKKRLLIVADGALQYVPFSALPIPQGNGGDTKKRESATDYRPMIVEHEIVNLPSSSTLAVIRREIAGRKPADKTVAVIADPVFDADDERVATAKSSTKAADQSVRSEERGLFIKVEKAAAESGLRSEGLSIPRLPGTRQETEKIMALAPANARMKVLDFEANRAAATSPELGQYRYVHFATHGFLNAANPELSGIVLSMVDQQGRTQNGFLLAHEVFNLHLPAELVVLSACQTGLGKEVKGEGLIGLTRGFMYAGAPRVIVSLWSVDDEATSELMAQLYKGILKEGMRPAEALRAAQINLWKQKRWQAPYYWAAFVLQGEWK